MPRESLVLEGRGEVLDPEVKGSQKRADLRRRADVVVFCAKCSKAGLGSFGRLLPK